MHFNSKDWHDEEANIDWKTRKSKNSNTVYCFSQVVWERATKLGCGRGTLKSRPFYVAQMDIAAIVQEGTVGYELDNIKKPVQVSLCALARLLASECNRGQSLQCPFYWNMLFIGADYVGAWGLEPPLETAMGG